MAGGGRGSRRWQTPPGAARRWPPVPPGTLAAGARLKKCVCGGNELNESVTPQMNDRPSINHIPGTATHVYIPASSGPSSPARMDSTVSPPLAVPSVTAAHRPTAPAGASRRVEASAAAIAVVAAAEVEEEEAGEAAAPILLSVGSGVFGVRT